MTTPIILLLSGISPEYNAELEKHGRPVRAIASDLREKAIADLGEDVKVVITNGFAGLTQSEMERMPQLKLICCVGVGYENIDLACAKSRGIPVSFGPNTNADAVADHALALVLGLLRRVVEGNDAACRGIERNQLSIPEQLHGKKLGLFGLGQIGSRIAKRAAGGFDAEVGYVALQPREEFSYRYFDNLVALADWCDVLVLAAPGGSDTNRLVNAEVLQALGPKGYLVNVARGSLVDEEALAKALRNKHIKAAALDVYDSEPHAPYQLINSGEVLLSPHVAGRSEESMRNMAELVMRNMNSFFAGNGLVTPVPEQS
ncbi:2-hydroxyacid dehydrogenase [Pseudorhodoferax soli]|uniref:Lactate dehydrogenase-like 2-hydroxyacid dehydrogenase n=1 Tax=Pseudorhodoferax soli TaxID=545864 RepID=A0A368XL41_9BURK|nr:2-hydroxyacid dehydrogenase [Pseudorhodoferax soli]RCW68575.1 lactate dehydrogenase-like 2-hydroxyacid dehydrogenase [Pseudorhodoferax soli]